MAPANGWRAALGRLFVGSALLGLVLLTIVLLALLLERLGWPERRRPPAPASTSATSGEDDRYVSELTPAGYLKSPDSPAAMRSAAAKARALFSDTRWEEFIVWTRRIDGSDPRRTWIVHVEPKSGGPDSTIWVKIEYGELREFGIRWGKKLKGYRGKLAPSAAGRGLR